MEMQLNFELLKQERDKRAWSQSHLAELCGVSLRTIQRIEKSGSASIESAKALASVYELELHNLQYCDPKKLASLDEESRTGITKHKLFGPALFLLCIAFAHAFNSNEIMWLWEKQPGVGYLLIVTSLVMWGVILFGNARHGKGN